MAIIETETVATRREAVTTSVTNINKRIVLIINRKDLRVLNFERQFIIKNPTVNVSGFLIAADNCSRISL